MFDESVAGYPKTSYTNGSATGTRVGYIAWSDISAFVLQVFPPTVITGSVTTIGFGVAYPGVATLRAESMDIEPYGVMTGSSTKDFATSPTFEKAKVTINYKTVTIPEYTWSIGGEFLSMPTKELKWSADSSEVTEDVQVGLMVPTIEHEVKIPRVKNPPFATIREHVGQVNDVDVVFPTGTAKSETLLFLGAHFTPVVMADGTTAFDLSYKYSEKETEADDEAYGGWNHFWRPDAKGFYRIIRSGTTDGVYKKIDHNHLMVSGAGTATPAAPSILSGTTTPPATP